MEFGTIIGIITAIALAIGLPLALRKRKKAGPQKREELYRHLQILAVKASLTERGSDKEQIGLSRFSGQRSEGVIELKNRNVDSINVISISSQYGVNYFIDYLVKSPNLAGSRLLKKTRLVRKKSSLLSGKTITLEWKGDESLAWSLNLDHRLADKLSQDMVHPFKGTIWIYPELKYGYVRIRTSYSLPSIQVIEAVDIIARHVKSY